MDLASLMQIGSRPLQMLGSTRLWGVMHHAQAPSVSPITPLCL